jgi:hypothetical protein
MLAWWRDRVERVDLAIRRSCGAMIWVEDRELDRLPLAWARAENSKGADVYIRPARGYDWPLLFLDDLPVPLALRAVRHYAALAVRTSPAGGCHLWLATSRDLDERQRHVCQRHLAELTGADPASTLGEHLGRLAGFRNHKRQGPWVNVLAAAGDPRPPWHPPDLLLVADQRCPSRGTPGYRSRGGVDRSPSGIDWAWTCRQLERGTSSDRVLSLLIARCRQRRGRDAERYAQRTVERATAHVSR